MGAPEAERGNASAAEVALPLSIIAILPLVLISTPQILHRPSEPTGILTCDATIGVAWVQTHPDIRMASTRRVA
jgi:hypothetical protein